MPEDPHRFFLKMPALYSITQYLWEYNTLLCVKRGQMPIAYTTGEHMKQTVSIMILVFVTLCMACDNNFHDLIEENTDSPEQTSDDGNDAEDDGNDEEDDGNADHLVYVISANSSIELFAINADNYIHHLDSTSGNFTSLGINTHTKYIYTWDNAGSAISSYSIGSDSTLTHESSTESIDGTTNMAMTQYTNDPNYIFMAHRPGGTGYISRTRVNGNTITPLGNTHTSLYWNIRPFLHSSIDVLYMQHKMPYRYGVYTFDDAGIITPQSSIEISGSCYVKNVVMNPSGTKLYVAGSDGVYHMDVDDDGDLSNPNGETGDTSFWTLNSITPRDIAIHPSEEWLYVSGDDGSINSFKIDPGTEEPESDISYSSEAGVSNINVISSDLLIATSTADNSVQVWTIDTDDGSLSKKDEISCTAPSSFVFDDL